MGKKNFKIEEEKKQNKDNNQDEIQKILWKKKINKSLSSDDKNSLEKNINNMEIQTIEEEYFLTDHSIISKTPMNSLVWDDIRNESIHVPCELFKIREETVEVPFFSLSHIEITKENHLIFFLPVNSKYADFYLVTEFKKLKSEDIQKILPIIENEIILEKKKMLNSVIYRREEKDFTTCSLFMLNENEEIIWKEKNKRSLLNFLKKDAALLIVSILLIWQAFEIAFSIGMIYIFIIVLGIIVIPFTVRRFLKYKKGFDMTFILTNQRIIERSLDININHSINIPERSFSLSHNIGSIGLKSIKKVELELERKHGNISFFFDKKNGRYHWIKFLKVKDYKSLLNYFKSHLSFREVKQNQNTYIYVI